MQPMIQRVRHCVLCGGDIASGGRIDRRYCSGSCRTLAYRARLQQHAKEPEGIAPPPWSVVRLPPFSSALAALGELQSRIALLTRQLSEQEREHRKELHVGQNSTFAQQPTRREAEAQEAAQAAQAEAEARQRISDQLQTESAAEISRLREQLARTQQERVKEEERARACQQVISAAQTRIQELESRLQSVESQIQEARQQVRLAPAPITYQRQHEPGHLPSTTESLARDVLTAFRRALLANSNEPSAALQTTLDDIEAELFTVARFAAHLHVVALLDRSTQPDHKHEAERITAHLKRGFAERPELGPPRLTEWLQRNEALTMKLSQAICQALDARLLRNLPAAISEPVNPSPDLRAAIAQRDAAHAMLSDVHAQLQAAEEGLKRLASATKKSDTLPSDAGADIEALLVLMRDKVRLTHKVGYRHLMNGHIWNGPAVTTERPEAKDVERLAREEAAHARKSYIEHPPSGLPLRPTWIREGVVMDDFSELELRVQVTVEVSKLRHQLEKFSAQK